MSDVLFLLIIHLTTSLSCSWSYIFIHYALLVAYVARSSDILTNYLHIPLYVTCLNIPTYSLVTEKYALFTPIPFWVVLSCYFKLFCVFVRCWLQHYGCRWESATLFSLVLGGICYLGRFVWPPLNLLLPCIIFCHKTFDAH